MNDLFDGFYRLVMFHDRIRFQRFFHKPFKQIALEIPVVKDVLSLNQVKRQILPTNRNIVATDRAFHNTPKPFNRIGMNCATNPFFLTVING